MSGQEQESPADKNEVKRESNIYFLCQDGTALTTLIRLNSQAPARPTKQMMALANMPSHKELAFTNTTSKHRVLRGVEPWNNTGTSAMVGRVNQDMDVRRRPTICKRSHLQACPVRIELRGMSPKRGQCVVRVRAYKGTACSGRSKSIITMPATFSGSRNVQDTHRSKEGRRLKEHMLVAIQVGSACPITYVSLPMFYFDPLRRVIRTFILRKREDRQFHIGIPSHNLRHLVQKSPHFPARPQMHRILLWNWP
ncbi:hypothetical protein BDZ89DRAFT_1041059 [Hymenopellis radicata]|nr:hypothetical protein BDZ89DRAFT_1041059 [Hymenopellis radicata]